MVRVKRSQVSALFAAVLGLVCVAGGCGSKGGAGLDPSAGSGSSGSSGGGGGGGGADSSSVGDDAGSNCTGGGCSFASDDSSAPPPPTCAAGGLHCAVPTCSNGAHTTLSGTVYDPAGKNPLYNVVVFVPNDPAGKLAPIKTGTNSCNTCDASIGDYVAVATTDAKGRFTLTDVPATTHVPLVVQTGKWRRETFINTIAPCQDTKVPAANSRLPRNHMEGDMPQMLLLTGGCDDLGCFMRNIGVDASEFSAPHGGGRLDVYQGSGLVGSGAGLSSATAGTWGTPAFTKQAYEYYDIAILSCECAEHNEPAAGRQALHDWLGEGGKVFASHYQYTWFSAGPADFQGVATWLGGSIAVGSGNYTLDTSFPKGMVLQQWLQNVGAVTGNTIALNSVANSVSTVNKPTVRWIYDPATTPNDTKYLSFLTPIGGIPGSDAGEAQGPQYCGKAVFTDLHTSSGLLASAANIPGDCTVGPLTAQQAALEFLFFDLSACVALDSLPPPMPPPPMPPK